MRVLVLVIDAFGGHGGVAQYGRDLLAALCERPDCEEVVAIPRYMESSREAMPLKLTYLTAAVNSKVKYILTCLRMMLFGGQFDLIICGHINLLPLASVWGRLIRCPVVPIVYGIEAWTPNSKWLINYFCGKVRRFISIRELTSRRFARWARLEGVPWYYLPNCIDTARYSPGPKDSRLMEKYGVRDKTVIMTTGRLDPASHERYKGFDELLEVLPALREVLPEVVYIIVGDGDDMARLKEKADGLGVADIVIFTGRISAEEKVDHYRLADVFAMPGSNKKFDRYPIRYVFLEALACGIPVVGSRPDGEGEENSLEGRLINQVDPCDPNDIIAGVLRALEQRKGIAGAELSRYSYEEHKLRVMQIVNEIIDARYGRVTG